jgi:hypothetical protein
VASRKEVEVTLPIKFAAIINEKLSVVLTYAFSHQPLQQMLIGFKGEWKCLRKTVEKIPEEAAERACIELATMLRLLDDREGLADYLKKTGGEDLGTVVQADGTRTPLYVRDLTNKVVHAADLRWDFSAPENPKLICVSNQPARWTFAEVEIVKLAALCGELMH